MSALLRYVYLKSLREHLLIGLLLAPAVMMLAPVAMTAIVEAIRGPGAFHNVAPGSVRGLATILAEVSAFIGVLIAGIGSFWVLREEIASRQMGIFLLARQPSRATAAMLTFGATTGFLSFCAAATVLSAVMGALPVHFGTLLVMSAVGSLITAAVGAAAVSFSPELPMLVPLYLFSLAVGVFLGKSPTRLHLAGAAITFIVAAVAAPYLLDRRCAA